MEMGNYYLGLDMGTASVGWAVTDENYNLLRAKGKDMWGIREFETAETAETRRLNRISRRRNWREKERIGYLKECFADAINAVDPNFYTRLENSKYYLEDKDSEVQSPNAIFDDENYKDKDYYKEYPTIFHLRKELIENEHAPYDVRLIYLAVLNIYKRRGHFLNSSIDIDKDDFSVGVEKAYSNMVRIFNERDEDDEGRDKAFTFRELKNENDALKLEEILSDRGSSRKRKEERLAELLLVGKPSAREKEVLHGMVGLAIDCNKLFNIEDDENKIKAKFSDFSYADNEEEILSRLGDANSEALSAIKSVYDAGVLSEILKGEKYLSFARVDDYEQHKSDLKRLKKVIHKYKEEEYDWFFRKAEDGSYSAYVNSVNSNNYNKERYDEKNPVRRGMASRSKEEFYKSVKKVVGSMPQEDEDVSYIMAAIENDAFMPKQLTGANGVIPNQLHAIELKKILENASEYLDFLNEVDETGLPTKERILKLFMFTLPYYVGPTSEKSKTGWAIRKEEGTVYPWNIEEKIDIPATEKEFIDRMVRKCTYYTDERVLPKSSLKYEMYCVLNEVNNIRIDGRRIDNELKKSLVNELYKKKGKPTRKAVEKFLYLNGIPSDTQITGIDKEINNGLLSYKKFHEIFGDEMDKDACRAMVEDMIALCTIYGDAKDRLRKAIREKYPEKEYPLLTDKAIKRITALGFKDWGRLSAKLLDLQGCNTSTGEIYSLLDALWETNYNFMELIHSEEFDYRDRMNEIEAKAVKSISEIDADFLDSYYFSAPVKRMIKQTLGIIEEITSVMGSAPERLFIEMVRSDQEKGDKGRKDSRKKSLLELYKKIQSEIDYGYWSELICKEDESGRLKSKKMYLYIKQQGKDMYTGEPIDLDDLFDSNKYDIDHIYPQRYVKDNNLENNMVLTSKEANEHIKKDLYPIPDKIRKNPKVMALWECLHQSGMINDVKYARLRCSETFTEYQQADFIARQVVETGQATKGVADILKLVLPDTTIVYSKAGNVSDFRNNNSNYKGMNHKLYKSRMVNDFHHAHDAYLNIVVGNVYYTKFTQNPLHFIQKEYHRDPEKFKYSMRRMYDFRVEREGKVAWIPKRKEDEFGTIDTVIKVLSKNTPLLTRKSFVKPGVINKVTLYDKHTAGKSPDSYLSPKTSDPKMSDVSKYGGYTSINICYFFLVEYEKKGKKVRIIEGLPGYLLDKVEKNPEELERYCEEVLHLSDYSIRFRKIRIQSLLRINGYYVYLSGKTGNQIILRNAVQMILPSELYAYVHILEKGSEADVEKELSSELNIKLYDVLIDKFTNTIFEKRPNNVGNTLIKLRDNFLNLETKKQGEELLNILNMSAVGQDGLGDLSGIEGKKFVGKLLCSKNISNNEEVLLYNRSFTGLYDSRPIDLLRV